MAGKGRVTPREIADRRLKVSRLRLSGVRNQVKIAEQLGVSHDTISRDFDWLDKLWAQEYLENVAREKALDLARLDRLIEGAWEQASTGSVPHVRVINELLARRAALLGADAPVKREVSGPDGGPIPLREVVVELTAAKDE